MSAVVLHARATDRESRPPCIGLKLAMDVTSKLVTPVSVATMAPASLSQLLGGPFSRCITMFASTPVLGVLLLDCNATVHEVHLEFWVGLYPLKRTKMGLSLYWGYGPFYFECSERRPLGLLVVICMFDYFPKKNCMFDYYQKEEKKSILYLSGLDIRVPLKKVLDIRVI